MIFAVTPVVLSFYALEEKTKQLTILLVLIHNVCNAVAFPLGKGLRAAGDVKFTMIISLVTTIGIRLVFSVFFGIILNMGVIGIALAMCLDWITRGMIFILRQRGVRHYEACKLYEPAKRYLRNNRVYGSISQKSAFAREK